MYAFSCSGYCTCSASTWTLSSKNRFAEDEGEGTTEVVDAVRGGGQVEGPAGGQGGAGTVVGGGTVDGGLGLGGGRELLLLRTLGDVQTGA